MTIPIVHQAPLNRYAATENRQTLDALEVICLNLTGAAGSGKTSLLEAVIPRIEADLRVGVVQADHAATCDAQRIGELGIPVVQVLTDNQCHLSANQLQHAMTELPLADLDLLIVESTGSLVHQSTTHLGEHLRMATVSVTTGDALPGKYPLLFHDAAVILLTKFDLLPHVEFNLSGTVHEIERDHPSAELICTDIRNRVGIDRLSGWILGYVRAQRVHHLREAELAGCVPS